IMLIPSMAVLIITIITINITMGISLGLWIRNVSLWDTNAPVWLNLLAHFFSYGYMTIFIAAYHIEVKIKQKREKKDVTER
ncbi:MAG: hypothetical protein IJ725_03045, partial [Ruminococcus sp.]|nr:hypothetical protein [Ruminococcus sp.]